MCARLFVRVFGCRQPQRRRMRPQNNRAQHSCKHEQGPHWQTQMVQNKFCFAPRPPANNNKVTVRRRKWRKTYCVSFHSPANTNKVPTGKRRWCKTNCVSRHDPPQITTRSLFANANGAKHIVFIATTPRKNEEGPHLQAQTSHCFWTHDTPRTPRESPLTTHIAQNMMCSSPRHSANTKRVATRKHKRHKTYCVSRHRENRPSQTQVDDTPQPLQRSPRAQANRAKNTVFLQDEMYFNRFLPSGTHRKN